MISCRSEGGFTAEKFCVSEYNIGHEQHSALGFYSSHASHELREPAEIGDENGESKSQTDAWPESESHT